MVSISTIIYLTAYHHPKLGLCEAYGEQLPY